MKDEIVRALLHVHVHVYAIHVIPFHAVVPNRALGRRSSGVMNDWINRRTMGFSRKNWKYFISQNFTLTITFHGLLADIYCYNAMVCHCDEYRLIELVLRHREEDSQSTYLLYDLVSKMGV